ncbi:MAG: DNA gyrase subunit A [Maricaulis maris]|uniref:DNA gyrase subunit A n=1 Tax=Maricaulis maris (strain MCS10) TaxID=394221 RepID=Q0ANH2_MARMM|nr:DNA gyrase subunit A [Maricaulis maris]ABI66165.1 DNA gyrase subunit A [Maricaulis maris MCS10]
MSDHDDTPTTPEDGSGNGADNTGGQPPALPDGIGNIAIEDEMKSSYLDYAMSVIVSRAIPDARDGLKPVHRRILYTMHENGQTHEKSYRKCATAVGDVMGRYHPHGDQAVYDSLVRLAQDWSMRVPLIDGQGNFGSVDGDPPAAYRYTEARMQKVAQSLLADIDKDTVNFVDNYSAERQEPVVLPARYPNLLVNGAGGIAVGMATNVPPHNLGEVIDGTLALLENPSLTEGELLDYIPGPDFPTGGLILGRTGARNAVLTGRGSIVMRSRTSIEEVRKDRMAIIVHEIPYQVNKASMIEKIADLVRDKKIEGIADLRDESDRNGMRVVIELKRDANADVILNQLFRWSPMQTSFGANMLSLVGGRPQLLGALDILKEFLRFREEVVARRAKFELNKARDRAHVIIGLALAVANIDEVIALIRKAPNPATAREQLMARDWPAMDVAPLVELVADPRSMLRDDNTLRLTEEQARAILELRLNRLTGLGREELGNEAKTLADQIADLLDLLRSRQRVLDIIRDELTEVRENYATPRRSEFVDAELDFEDEDLIPRDEMVVTVTHGGYAKRTALSDYRAQRRGGKGRSGMATKDEDFIATLFVASTHAPLLFFSNRGMVYKTKTWRLPLGAPNTRGKALINLLPLEQGETITSIMALPEDESTWADMNVMFATNKGTVRRNKLSDFVQVNRNGKIAMKLEEEDDQIVNVVLCTEQDDVFLTTHKGRAIRFPATDVRVFAGRNSVGVRGIRLAEGDELISMAILHHIDVTSPEARAYMKHATAMRRALGDDEEIETVNTDGDEDGDDEAALSTERLAELGAAEEFLLTVASDGMGKRSSAYDFRVMGRGNNGVAATDIKRDIPLSASFPVEDADQIMAVTDGGQLIRFPVDTVRIASRSSRGVRLIRLNEGENVVAVVRIQDAGDEGDEDGDGETVTDAGPAPEAGDSPSE